MQTNVIMHTQPITHTNTANLVDRNENLLTEHTHEHRGQTVTPFFRCEIGVKSRFTVDFI